MNSTERTISKRLNSKGQTTIGFKCTFQRFATRTRTVSIRDKFEGNL